MPTADEVDVLATGSMIPTRSPTPTPTLIPTPTVAGATRKNLLAKLVALGLSLGLVCVVLEGGLRLVGVIYNGSFFTGDTVRGWALRPGAHGWYVGDSKVYIRVNGDGWRDHEHGMPKPPNTVRIAVLGDSYAEALNVPTEKAFWAVMERQLSGCAALGNRKVEVLNFGVSGYGTAQELLTLHERVWKYDPDIILLAFYTGNDFFNNCRALNPYDTTEYPYFVYQGQQLIVDDSFRHSAKFSNPYMWFFNVRGDLQNRSRLVEVLSAAIKGFQTRKEKGSAARSAAALGVGDLEDMIYSSPSDERMKEAWRVTEGLLASMRDEVRSHGAELWVATLSNRAQIDPDPNQRQATMKRLGVDTLFYPDLRLRGFAQQAGISDISLAEPMADYAQAHHVYLNGGQNLPLGTGHWNEAGHRLAGELIAAELCAHSSRRSPNAVLPH